MNDKTEFLLKYGKDGVHYDYEHEFRKALDEKVVGPALYKHPLFSEKHLDKFVSSNPIVGRSQTFGLFLHVEKNGILKQHHIERLFDSKSDIDKQDVITLPGANLSTRIGHWMFDHGSTLYRIHAISKHPSVARKVLDEIASSKNPDFAHPNSVWQEALRNKDAVTPNDLEIAKKSGHSMVRYTANNQ